MIETEGSLIAPIELITLEDPALAALLNEATSREAYEAAIGRVATSARPHKGKGIRTSVSQRGLPEFQHWVGRNPDRLSVQVEGETWNAAVLPDGTVLASVML